jgi:hypothetical protein
VNLRPMPWLPPGILALVLGCTGAPDALVDAPPPAGSTAPAPRRGAAGAAAQALLDRHATEGATPEGALALWLEAALLAGTPGSEDEGARAIGQLTAEFRPLPDWRPLPSARTFRDRLSTHPHVFRSYFLGATPDNGYEPTRPLALRVHASADDGERGHRVVVVSGGADNPRPVFLRKSRKDGLYYVTSFANLYVEVRPPLDPDREF